MKSLLVFLSVVAVAFARPGLLGWPHAARSFLYSPWAYSSVAPHVAYSAVPSPVARTISSQFHSQDELGQYSYGYSDGLSTKNEIKSVDGVTRGGYSYVDSEGKIQSVNYAADPVHGFRVAATNLPVAPEPIPAEPLVAPEPVQDTPEVAAAKVAHEIAYNEAKAAADAAPDVNIIEGPSKFIPASHEPVIYAYSSIAPGHVTHRASVAPISRFAYSAVSPVVNPVSYPQVIPYMHPHVTPHVVSTQYHSQDELGQYSYGYSGGPSSKSEVKTIDGVTRGGYSYVDAEGKVQNVNYVADPINGFRVSATNLPVVPVDLETPVLDTDEVAAAKAQHLAAHEEAKARLFA
ncbi:hypothetical protein J437_LFUL016527 [Ladona fulva]|uniref:Cuticle protein 6 n=1 Tax=Ladona fulva TaxID=123851 RepID=A0A8K0KKK2_LADFU|nr:hypothetical protein J437_LFUL016527 [Ladona fulva]